MTSQSQFRSVWSNYINSFCFKLFSSFWVDLLALRYQSIWTIRSNPEQLFISSLLLHVFEETTLRWYSPVMQFASPWNSAFTCFTQFHRTPIDNNAMTHFIIVTDARLLRRHDFLVILDHSGTCWTSSSAPLPASRHVTIIVKHVLLRHLVKG